MKGVKTKKGKNEKQWSKRGAFFSCCCALCLLSSLYPSQRFISNKQGEHGVVYGTVDMRPSSEGNRQGKGAAQASGGGEKKKTQKQHALFFSLDDRLFLLLLGNDASSPSSAKRVLPRKGHVQEAVDVLVLVVDVCHEGGCFFYFFVWWKKSRRERKKV